MSERRVWTLLYEHKDGTDVSVYANKRAAELAAMGLVLDFLDEFTGGDEEAAEEVRDHIAKKDWSAVQARLAKCESDESIEFGETIVFTEAEAEKYVELLVENT